MSTVPAFSACAALPRTSAAFAVPSPRAEKLRSAIRPRHSASARPSSGRSQFFGARTFEASRIRRTAAASVSFSISAAQQKQYGTFEDLLADSEVPLLVDFFATWCGPCQMLGPMLSELAEKMTGRLRVVKIDSDMYPTISSKLGVRALPTLILFKDGKPVDRLEGVLPKEELFARYEALIQE